MVHHCLRMDEINLFRGKYNLKKNEMPKKYFFLVLTRLDKIIKLVATGLNIQKDKKCGTFLHKYDEIFNKISFNE